MASSASKARLFLSNLWVLGVFKTLIWQSEIDWKESLSIKCTGNVISDHAACQHLHDCRRPTLAIQLQLVNLSQ
jgi:hypothetical protein